MSVPDSFPKPLRIGKYTSLPVSPVYISKRMSCWPWPSSTQAQRLCSTSPAEEVESIPLPPPITAYLITIPIKSTTRPAMQTTTLQPVLPQPLPPGSDEWGHQACQLPPEVSRLPPLGSQALEMRRRGGGVRVYMPELTLGRAGTERTGGNTGSMGRAGETEGYRMNTQDQAPATQRAGWTHTPR